ncbi:MAG: hypothetical protein HFI63_00180 [Lachnospiraceae bacterium]|nr:hypothetical protein [Lachnospiraceae bacterium]
MNKKKGNPLSEIKKTLEHIGISRVIVVLFFVFLLCMTPAQEMPGTISNVLTRVGMHGVLVLAMVPSIRSGLGPNFAVPFGILAGLLGGLISVEFQLTGIGGFAVAVLLAMAFSLPMGLLFGYLMNRVKGSEMMVATYFGYALVSIMCIGWLLLPFTNNAITWSMGKGLRNTINLQSYFGNALNDLGAIKKSYGAGEVMMIPVWLLLIWLIICGILYWKLIRTKQVDVESMTEEELSAWGSIQEKQKKTGTVAIALATVLAAVLAFGNLGFLKGIRSALSIHLTMKAGTSMEIPTGMLLFLILCCFGMWLFNRSKTGIAMSAAGQSPDCARAGGVNIGRQRMIGAVMSTMLAAVGILVYAQSFGFLQLYNAPINMCFPPIAAILIGGASIREAKISHVLVGVLLFQGILTMGPTIAGRYLSGLGEGIDPTEIVRIIITNGIILYALTKAGGVSDEE